MKKQDINWIRSYSPLPSIIHKTSLTKYPFDIKTPQITFKTFQYPKPITYVQALLHQNKSMPCKNKKSGKNSKCEKKRSKAKCTKVQK